jgi:transposase
MNIGFLSCREDTIFLSRFLPDPLPPHLDAWQLDHTATLLTLHVTSTQRGVTCPVCAVFTHRVHSGYTRLLADLPWGAARVRWQLRVRKCFCGNPQCPRRIFTERLPGVVAPWARRAQRLAAWLSAIGLALGGAAGTRLSRRLGLRVSRHTLLRVVRRLPLPCDSTPQALGIDDFAFRTRQTYGTVLIDLECRRPVALLPDREAETGALWLQAHPGVEVIARDRSKAYERGIRQGAPTITQVADRFHLLQNLAETLEQVFSRHSVALKAVNEAMRSAGRASHDSPGVAPVPLAPRPPLAQAIATRRRAQRSAAYEQVWTMRRQGCSGEAIARRLGIGRCTVFRYLRAPTFPERKARSDRGRSVLSPYKADVLRRWNDGCHEALQLFEGLKSHGYAGSYVTVARYAQRLREAQGLAPRQRRAERPLPVVGEPTHAPLTVRQAAWLVLRRSGKCTPADKDLLVQLHTQHAELAEAIELAQDFVPLVRKRRPQRLDAWLTRATKSPLVAWQRVATRLREDYGAVKAGVTLPWSTGPVEGHINRLKMLKRQMFGRAHLDLLHRRFVLAA